MSDEATITINGTHLTEHESAIIRMAVEAFTIVMAQGIEERDEGIAAALTEPNVAALVEVQKLLDIGPGRSFSPRPIRTLPRYRSLDERQPTREDPYFEVCKTSRVYGTLRSSNFLAARRTV
jgi:hypothetical protein